MEREISAAHIRSIRHRDEIESSEVCGCFYCLEIFAPKEITSWCDFEKDEIGGKRYGHTALCPNCSIDSVIGSKSGFPITKEFLAKMNKNWF